MWKVDIETEGRATPKLKMFAELSSKCFYDFIPRNSSLCKNLQYNNIRVEFLLVDLYFRFIVCIVPYFKTLLYLIIFHNYTLPIFK